jgi:hypothetical protein
MFVGIAISLTADLLSLASPVALFANGEVGAWYDPSDLTTLFQDSAGTTPVTAPNQTVGLMLDKSGRGNNATQATSTQRPIYGINPIVGTRNLIVYSEQFENAAWGKVEATVTSNATTAPDGTNTADALIPSTSSVSSHQTNQAVSNLTVGPNYTFSVYAKPFGYNWVRLQHGGSFAFFNLSTGVVGTTGSASGTIASVGNGWYRCSLIAPAATTTINPAIRPQTADNQFAAYAGDGTSGIYIWGAQIELGSTATAYQKVVSQYEVTEAGVQSASYLAFDGVDDGMVTNTITPAIDKVQVFAGVRKLSDAAQKIVAEMSATIASNNGAFALTAPNSAAANYNFSSKGTTQTDNVVTTYTAPITSVISGLGDIAGASNFIRVNGSQIGSVLTTQGTGNYLAYPLYIGRRGGTTLPYNGRIYSMIVRFGANLTTGQITSTESYVNGKTGAY